MARISEISNTESTSVSDGDLFEGEESGGASFKTAFSVIKSTLETYFDSVYQGLDTALTALANGVTAAANKIPYFTSGSAADTLHYWDGSMEDGEGTGVETLASVAAIRDYVKARQQYVLYAVSTAASNPADSTTYYIGGLWGLGNLTTNTIPRVYIPASGVIKRVDGQIRCTPGTSENAELYIGNPTDGYTLLSSTIDLSSANVYFNYTGLEIDVEAGDYVNIQFTTPTWVTNPTGLTLTAQIYIEAV